MYNISKHVRKSNCPEAVRSHALRRTAANVCLYMCACVHVREWHSVALVQLHAGSS
jgi:hypothetical protein